MKITIFLIWAVCRLEFGLQIKTDKPMPLPGACLSPFKSSLHEYVFFFSELYWFLKPAQLPSICSGFEGFGRALDFTIVCSASQVICA